MVALAWTRERTVEGSHCRNFDVLLCKRVLGEGAGGVMELDAILGTQLSQTHELFTSTCLLVLGG